MKNQKHKNTSTISGIFVLILGGVVTSILIALRYFKVVHMNNELILAPLIVLFLLMYGEKLLTIIMISAMRLFFRSTFNK